MTLRNFLMALLLCSSLSGCVSLWAPSLEQSWQGRFSIVAQGHSNRQAHSGRFYLTHSDTPTTILDLKSSLGNTIARVTQTSQSASLEAVGSQPLQAKNAQELMMQTFGFSVPIDGLQYWIDGKTVPNKTAQTKPLKPPYQEIIQNGWIIRYENLDSEGLPRRIKLLRTETLESPSLSIVLLITERKS